MNPIRGGSQGGFLGEVKSFRFQKNSNPVGLQGYTGGVKPYPVADKVNPGSVLRCINKRLFSRSGRLFPQSEGIIPR